MGTDDVLDRAGLETVFADDFDGGTLDDTRWLPHYLPQWTTPDRSAARFSLDGDGLALRIDADQPAWRTQDGALRVSNLQTGSFSGPAGSPLGQHRHVAGLSVVTPQPTRRLWTPSSGVVEATMSAPADPTCLLAFWMVGFEEWPQASGEICVAELFGDAIGPGGSRVRLGVKAHHDPELVTAMVDLDLDLDATRPHTYAAEWDARRTRFFVDDVLVHTVEQGVGYPLQVMVDLFELRSSEDRHPADYPKTARVRSVRGYARRPC